MSGEEEFAGAHLLGIMHDASGSLCLGSRLLLTGCGSALPWPRPLNATFT